ncbi:zinc dependent phospholipase C family protein [Anaerosphaera multitolerans]|nr:zinc dependent phospholipase C family protein [Anaerosphaera multitolerans]
MASIYTHHKFGLMIREKFNSDLYKVTLNYKEEYLLGQQGPDFLFFNPKFFLKKVPPGVFIHNKSLKDFLDRNMDYLKSQPLNSPALSYTVGFICHFILDSKIHPAVNNLSTKNYTHQEVESELDRYLLKVDNLNPTAFHMEDLVPRNKNTFKDILPLYKSYSSIDEKSFYTSLDNFYKWKKFFHSESKIKETVILSTMKILGVKSTIGGQVMRQEPLPGSAHSNKVLFNLFNSTLDLAPKLIYNALDYVFKDELPDEDFYFNFNGILNI